MSSRAHHVQLFIKCDIMSVEEFMVWECKVCGFVYKAEKGDEENGVAPGTPFEKVPDTWRCPICNSLKDYSFIQKDESEATPQ